MLTSTKAYWMGMFEAYYFSAIELIDGKKVFTGFLSHIFRLSPRLLHLNNMRRQRTLEAVTTLD
jgi:hypothetical protein